MKRPLLVILCAAMMVTPRALADGKDGDSPMLYYPLGVGSEWRYQVGKSTVITKVTKVEPCEGGMCAVLESSIDGKPSVQEQVQSVREGIYRRSFNGKAASTRDGLPILLRPVKDGKTWGTVLVQIGDERIEADFKCAKDHIKVLGTERDAMKVTTTKCTVNGVKAEFAYWFVLGMGIVKQTMKIGDTDAVIEAVLTGYKPGILRLLGHTLVPPLTFSPVTEDKPGK